MSETKPQLGSPEGACPPGLHAAKLPSGHRVCVADNPAYRVSPNPPRELPGGVAKLFYGGDEECLNKVFAGDAYLVFAVLLEEAVVEGSRYVQILPPNKERGFFTAAEAERVAGVAAAQPGMSAVRVFRIQEVNQAELTLLARQAGTPSIRRAKEGAFTGQANPGDYAFRQPSPGELIGQVGVPAPEQLRPFQPTTGATDGQIIFGGSGEKTTWQLAVEGVRQAEAEAAKKAAMRNFKQGLLEVVQAARKPGAPIPNWPPKPPAVSPGAVPNPKPTTAGIDPAKFFYIDHNGTVQAPGTILAAPGRCCCPAVSLMRHGCRCGGK